MTPTAIQLLDEKENPIANETTVGPLREGQQFTSICLVKNTRPEPSVAWYRSGKRLKGEYAAVDLRDNLKVETDALFDSVDSLNKPTVIHDEANGLTTVKSVLSITLTRLEMGANFECRVESDALEAMVRNSIKIDLQGNQAAPVSSYILKREEITNRFHIT